jgi:hypothetical protein
MPQNSSSVAVAEDDEVEDDEVVARVVPAAVVVVAVEALLVLQLVPPLRLPEVLLKRGSSTRPLNCSSEAVVVDDEVEDDEVVAGVVPAGAVAEAAEVVALLVLQLVPPPKLLEVKRLESLSKNPSSLSAQFWVADSDCLASPGSELVAVGLHLEGAPPLPQQLLSR